MDIQHAQLIQRLGGVSAVAARLGIKPPSVSGWIEDGRNGIPKGRLIELGAVIERELGIARWTLFPTDWHQIWPELISAKGAPALPQPERKAA
jgi:DNA-binding transcriptional regulator YdaS (Cro superfamily)